MPADMAGELSRIPVVGERHTAVRALADVAAGLTDHDRGKAPAIQEENGLLTIRKALLDRLQKCRRKDGFGPAGRGALRISSTRITGNLRSSTRCESLEQSVFSRGAMVPTFHGRSRAAENHRAAFLLGPENRDITSVIARRFFLLVGALVLFVDDDDTQLVQWREYRAAGPNHDPRGARMNSTPLIEALALGKMAVKHRHFPLEIRKARLKSFDRLWRKGDLRYQDERRATKIHRVPDGLKIDLGLPAAGYPEQQQRPNGKLDGFLRRAQRGALFRIQREILVGKKGLVGKGIARHLLSGNGQPAFALEAPKYRFATLRPARPTQRSGRGASIS